MNKQEPIIIIGAGRSGSTFLSKVLDSHPEINFHGETNFLLPRLWLELWEDRFWFNWKQYLMIEPNSACERFPEISDHILLTERKRIGNIIAHIIVDLFKISHNKCKVWGYKEIWNGSIHHNYEWIPYDFVFPKATWVHLIRNPFSFTVSSANWNKDDLTEEYLIERLKDWVDIVKYSRLRKSSKRYFEIRYEDLIKMPKQTLEPIFNYVDIEWDERCSAVLDKKIFGSINSKLEDSVLVTKNEIEQWILKIDNLKELMSELGYEIPDKLSISAMKESDKSSGKPLQQELNQRDISEHNNQFKNFPQSQWKKKYYYLTNNLNMFEQQNQELQQQSQQLQQQNQQQYPAILQQFQQLQQQHQENQQQLQQEILWCTDKIKQFYQWHNAVKFKGQTLNLNGPFIHDVNHCWRFSIPEYITFADNEFIQASQLVLFEDDKELGPPHALHYDIREQGEGLYSHWKENLYFSTSDNTDPNENNRNYWVLVNIE